MGESIYKNFMAMLGLLGCSVIGIFSQILSLLSIYNKIMPHN